VSKTARICADIECNNQWFCLIFAPYAADSRGGPIYRK